MQRTAVVLGIDGLGGQYLAASRGDDGGGDWRARMPTLARLMASRGAASTLEARTVYPPVSGPAWAAVLSGAAPDATGVDGNAWPDVADRCPPVFPSQCGGGGVIPSTLLDVAVAHGLPSALVVSWSWLCRLGSHFPPSARVTVVDAKGDDDAAVSAFAELQSRPTAAATANSDCAVRPVLSFVHLDLVDHAGHAHGWGSAKMEAAFGVADALLARVVAALPPAAPTLLVVCSDHGGSGTGHGALKRSHMVVPLAIVRLGSNGNGGDDETLAAPAALPAGTSNLSIAPTVCEWLGLPRAPWMHHPALGAR